jgi:subtilisin-like proprotein convertase family protein
MRFFLTFRSLILSLLALGIFPASLRAQPMEVTNTAPITPLNLITNIFLGEGVEVLDVQFEGSPAAVGFFREGIDAVNIDRGIVMSTGFAASAPGVIGANGIGTQQSSNPTSGVSSDPDMEQIARGNNIFDMVKYTITFVPISDTLRFRYVFASEEYPEYVCTEFNDIFGFFISGPGINGPYANGAINIARIPGTDLPVAINNVNPGQPGSAGGQAINCTPPNGSLAFSEFYNSNNAPTQPVFDGYTDVFTAEAVVMPCSTYTIKLVICDVSDPFFDSGVFLEARSFGTGSLKVDVATASLDGSIAEGCSAGMLSFSLPFRVENDYPIDYAIFGTAENGVDYAFIPPDLFIPAGDSVVSVPIIAFEDGIEEGTETLMIDIQRDPCNRDTIVIFIKDNPLVPADLGADLTICQGDTVLLDGTLPVPLPEPLTFYSADTLIILPAGVTLYSDILVGGVLPPTLGPGVIQSVCIDDLRHTWVDDMRIYLLSPGGQFLELVTDIGNPGDDFIGTCFTPSAIRPITSATLADQPFTGEWQPEGLWEDLYGETRPTNGVWQLSLFDKFAPDVGTLNRWSITFNPIYEIEYEWQPAAGLSCTDCPNPQAFPDTTTTYVMRATDSYGCETTDTITIAVIEALEAPQLTCALVTENSITVAWPPVPGAMGYEVNIDGTGWQPANGVGQHTLGGLPLATAVNFQVRALGQCPGFSGSIECSTPDCTPAALTVSNVVDASCFGGADGSISVSASGGTAPYTYLLGSESNSDGIFTGLTAGIYAVQVIDGEGCPGMVQAEVGQPADPASRAGYRRCQLQRLSRWQRHSDHRWRQRSLRF